MRIISWNIAGINARRTEAERLVAEYRPDILCLQKTRSGKAFEMPGYSARIDCADRWSGVASYVRNTLDCTLEESDTHHIILRFDGFVLVNAYAPYSNAKVQGYIDRRKEWDKWLHSFVCRQTLPVIICGDLNIVHTNLDTFYPSCVKNTGCYYPWERDNFNSLLTDGKLADSFRRLHTAERAYTYFDTLHGIDYRASGQGSRLDYFLVSETLMPRTKESAILTDFGSAPSVPVMLELEF